MPHTTNSRTGEGPYLTHVVSHHGQLTLVPPQNAGRVRKTSPSRSTRNLHLYDVASTRSPTIRARSPTPQTPTIMRPAQQDLAIPDFPPPSFQEAIADPVYRISTITASPSVVSLSTYYSLTPISPSESSYPTTSASSPTDRSVYQAHFDDEAAPNDPSPPDSDEGGLEMISLDASQTEWEDDRQQGLSLNDRVRREMERRQIAERYHHPSPSVLARQPTCCHCGASRAGDDGSSIPVVSPVTNEHVHNTPTPVARRRFLLGHKPSQSMSSASVPSTPISARNRPSFESISSSADSHRRSRSMSPTPRSSSPSSVVSAKPSLSFMSRKIFSSSKGKERSAKEEPLEAWEVLESAPAGSCQLPAQPPLSRLRRTLSKMSLANIGPSSSSLDSPRSPAIKPFPLQHTPVPQSLSEKHAPRTDLPPFQNRPVPPIPQAFQNRSMRSPPPMPPPLRTHSPLATNVYSPFSPFSASTVSPQSPDAGMQNQSKRLLLPPSRRNAPSMTTAVVERGRRQRNQSMSVPPTGSTVLFPPSSPMSAMSGFNGFRGHPFNASPFSSSPYASRHNAPSSALSYVTDKPESKSSSLLTVRPLAQAAPGHDVNAPPYPGPPSPTSPTSPASATSLTYTSPGSSPSSISGRHYPGRPLPHPPPASPFTETPINEIPFVLGDKKFPIPFANDSQDIGNPRHRIAFPRAQTPVIPETSEDPFPPPSPSLSSLTSRSSVVELDGSGEQDDDDNDDDDDDDDDEDTETISSESTDLDALIARIDGPDNYEDMPLASEVLGRGDGLPSNNRQQHHKPKADEELAPFVGRIEVLRRRVMKDGRVKVKLSLLGVGVENCGVCLSQFRDNECAALGPKCQHSYHEKCLKRWLKRNNACPLCRVPLD